VAFFASRRNKSGGKMSLAQHLVELRKRIMFAAIAILVGAVAGWLVSGFVWDALRAPVSEIVNAQYRHAQINYPDITSAFDLKFKIAIYVGLIVSSPVWLFQIFAFLAPGLTRNEKRYMYGFILTAIPLFLLGCASGWFVVPHVVELMTSFAPKQSAAYITAGDYFDFIMKLVVAIGIAFVLPVFVVLLNFAGVISAKSIIRSWKVATLLIILFTAIATPSADVVSMFLLALPMVVLYFGAYGTAWLHDRRVAGRTAEFDRTLTSV
jgi:sec-independent protein translocase protein TatC